MVFEQHLTKCCKLLWKPVCSWLCRPHQHGEDMLAPISDILNERTSEADAPVVSLALDGLYHLCEAEVSTHCLPAAVVDSNVTMYVRLCVVLYWNFGMFVCVYASTYMGFGWWFSANYRCKCTCVFVVVVARWLTCGARGMLSAPSSAATKGQHRLIDSIFGSFAVQCCLELTGIVVYVDLHSKSEKLQYCCFPCQ